MPCGNYVKECKRVDGESFFKGAHIVYSASASLKSARLFIKIDGEWLDRGAIESDRGYYEAELKLCAEYKIEWAKCEGTDDPIFHESSLNPTSVCNPQHLPKGGIAATTLPTDCFKTEDGLISLTPIVTIVDGEQTIFYYRGAELYKGNVGARCSELNCERCCENLNK